MSEPALMPPGTDDRRRGGGSLDDLNRDSPLKPLFFELDQSMDWPASKMQENAG